MQTLVNFKSFYGSQHVLTNMANIRRNVQERDVRAHPRELHMKITATTNNSSFLIKGKVVPVLN
jgi:hypothetical protein